MKLTPRIYSVFMTMLLAGSLTACSTTDNQTIPAVNENSIAEAAETLDITVEKLENYLKNIDVSYDDYINSLNSQNQTLEAYKTKIEENYDCTFEQYVDTVLTVNNKTVPDDKEYDLFKSKYSLFDAYVPSDELNAEKTTLVNYDIAIAVADEDADVYAFDVLATCGSDFRIYMDIINQNFGCSSVEITNMSIFGGHGASKPAETNPCMDNLFVYDSKTNEILEQITLAVITMHYDDENKTATYALSNELGLIFKTTGPDSVDKINKLSELNFQIRKADTDTQNNT